jgi:ADP-ribosylglycohydrolase
MWYEMFVSWYSRERRIEMVSMMERVQGCLLGIPIGDSLGYPVETFDPDEILEFTEGVGITAFRNNPNNAFKSMQHFKPGDTTDDWQLSRAVALAIVKTNGYDYFATVIAQLREYLTSRAGWGQTTKDGMAHAMEIVGHARRKGIETVAGVIRNPSYDKPGKGSGNGVAMKIAPVAIDHFLKYGMKNESILMSKVYAQGVLTHPDSRATDSAYAIAWLLCSLLDRPLEDDTSKAKDRLQEVIEAVRRFELHPDFRSKELQAERVSTKLEQIQRYGLIHNTVALREDIGTSCFCIQSIPFLIACFLRYPTDFRKGVLYTINNGGDTDTNGAMVASLIGANCGVGSIPDEWRKFNRKFEEAVEIGEEMFKIHN